MQQILKEIGLIQFGDPGLRVTRVTNGRGMNQQILDQNIMLEMKEFIMTIQEYIVE
jgi:hypothetical protein